MYSKYMWTLYSSIMQMAIIELYIPSRKTLPVLSGYGCSAASLMTQSSVREVITKYIKDNELVSPTNSRWFCATCDLIMMQQFKRMWAIKPYIQQNLMSQKY